MTAGTLRSLLVLLTVAALLAAAPAMQPADDEPTDDDISTTAPATKPLAFRDPTTNPATREGLARHRRRVDPLEGKPPPALVVDHWLNGPPLELAQLKGKVVLLDFFKPDGPSTVAMPYTNVLHDKYAGDGLVVIAISCTDDAATTERVVRERGIRYPVATDVRGTTTRPYHVDSYPDYYLIDRHGTLRIAD